MKTTRKSYSIDSYTLIWVVVLLIYVSTSISSKEAFSETIKVSQSESIQIVINDAKEGDIIELQEGKYAGRVRIDKSLTLRGAGKDKTRWDFIRVEKKGKEKEDPGGIKIAGKNITLTIEGMHLHSLKNLNTINLNSDTQRDAVLHVRNCKFTSEVRSWPVIYAQETNVNITDTVFENIKSNAIFVEKGCSLTIKNVKFKEGGGDYSQILIEKCKADIIENTFQNIKGICIATSGSKSDLTIDGCQFTGSGSGNYPSLWINSKAAAVATNCTFKSTNGHAIIVENRAKLKINGKTEFSGKVKSRKPLILITNGELIVGDPGSEDTTTFSNIEKFGIKIEDGGRLNANKCLFQGNAEKVVFVNCKKGKLMMKDCDFGDNKSSIIIAEGKGLHLEDCEFKNSQSCSVKINKLKASNPLILRCVFTGANDNCIKIEKKSSLIIRECKFECETIEDPCIDIHDYSNVTLTKCEFHDINANCIKAKKESSITVEECEFNGGNKGDNYLIYIERKSNASISGCTFDWANNKLFFAKDCKDIKLEGINSNIKNR